MMYVLVMAGGLCVLYIDILLYRYDEYIFVFVVFIHIM